MCSQALIWLPYPPGLEASAWVDLGIDCNCHDLLNASNPYVTSKVGCTVRESRMMRALVAARVTKISAILNPHYFFEKKKFNRLYIVQATHDSPK